MKVKKLGASFLICAVWAFIVLKSYFYFTQIIVTKENETFEKASIVLQDKIDSFTHALQGIGGIVTSYNYRPTIQQIRHYAEFRDFFRNFPGALGYGWISIVPDEKLEEHIKRKKQESHFYIYKQLREHHEDHYIIDAIEPVEVNEDALGLDISSEKNRREAAQRAIRSAKPTLTAPISLVQLKTGVGFLIYLPLYSSNVPPETVEEREKKIMGFAFAPISAISIIQVLNKKIPSGFSYEITDITDPASILPIYGSEKIENNVTSYSEKINIGERTWLFKAYSNDKTLIHMGQISAIIFLLLGWILLSSLTHFVINAYEERGRYKEEFESIQHLHQSILDSTHYSMITANKEGTITSFNKAAERLLGYRAQEVINKKTPAVFHDANEVMKRTNELKEELRVDFEPGFETFVIKSRLTKMPVRNEWTYIKKDGTRFPAELTITPIFDKEGNVSSYLGVAEDVSEFKKMEKIIEEQRLSMIYSAKLSALGEMAAGIAHEINNPLAILDGRLNLIKAVLDNQNITNQSIEDNFNKIQAMIDRIIKIVKGLRSFSRDGSKDNLQQIQLGKIIEETLELCQERFSKNKIEIEVSGDTQTSINCRQVEISQVIMNLLNNSFDSIKGKSEKWIKIHAEMIKGEKISITFTDSGSGIPQDIADRIMEPFFTTKEVGQGTGLGLSISKGIIESHSGVFKYNSKHPNTQFIIELPV